MTFDTEEKASTMSLVVRYRRSEGVERDQLHWFAFAMGLFLSYALVVGVLLEDILDLSAQIDALSPLGKEPFGFFLALVPISVGLALCRCRLSTLTGSSRAGWGTAW